jgi:putative flippase GtrA
MMQQLLRFAGVGLTATLVHVALALIMQTVFGFSPQLANLAGFCGAVLLSYFGHSRVTFGIEPDHAVHLPRFLTVSVIGLALSAAITEVVSAKFGGPFYLAMALVAVSVPPATYFASRFWAFAETGADARKQWVGVLVALLAATAFLAVYLGRSINHDTAWYLVAVRKWLSGATLYIDIVEVNPPLNFYLTVPVIWLSDATGLTDTNAQYAVLAVLMMVSLIWIWGLLGRLSLQNRIFVVCGIAAGLIMVPGENIGQREHLLILFILPWVVAQFVMETPDGGKAALARAVFATIGICLKPHFLLYPIAVTICLMIRDRSLRPILSVSNITMACIGAAYVAAVVVLHPAYLAEIVPMAAQCTVPMALVPCVSCAICSPKLSSRLRA